MKKLTPEQIRAEYKVRSRVLLKTPRLLTGEFMKQREKVCEILRMKNCPSEVLALALKEYSPSNGHYQPDIVEITGFHPNLDEKTIKKYLKWGIQHIDQLDDIGHILVNPNVPMSLLEDLVDCDYGSDSDSDSDSDSEDGYRPNIALGYAVQNPSCSSKLLNLGGESEDYSQRLSVARHTKISESLAEKLIHAEEVYVQEAIVKNPNTTIELLLDVLANFPDHTIVMEKWQKMLLLRAMIPRLPDGAEREQALDILSKISKGAKARAIKALYTTDITDLEDKCYDRNLSVRKAATRNPRVSEEGKIAVALLGAGLDKLG